MFHTVIVGKYFDDLHILYISMAYEELRIFWNDYSLNKLYIVTMNQ